jgi:hypothetical protein
MSTTTEKIAELWSADAETLQSIDREIAEMGFDASYIMTLAFKKIDLQIEAIDRRIATYEVGRMAVMREIEKYSEASARRLAANADVIEGQFTEAREEGGEEGDDVWAQGHLQRKNAQNSTGPRSELGQRRSSRNALSHGLAIAIGSDPSFIEDSESLATTLERGGSGQIVREFARQAADAQFDLLRIRKSKAARFATVLENPGAKLADYSERSEALAQLDRYERRAFSRRKRALLAMIEE